MARIRTIKPDFFKNEELSELQMAARLLFVGLWTIADRRGRLEDRPKRIKAELFPYDNVSVEEHLSRLHTAGFIERYEVGNLKVIQIIAFEKHQRITGTEAQSESELPERPASIEGNTQETLRKHSGNTQDDWKGKERKGKEEERSESENLFFSKENYLDNNPPETKKEEKPPRSGASPPRPKQFNTAIVFPWDNEEFKAQWEIWKDYKHEHFKFQYKGGHSEQAALVELANMAGGAEDSAIAILHHTIANGWKGFVKPKNDFNGQQASSSGQSGAGGINGEHFARMAERRRQNSGTG